MSFPEREGELLRVSAMVDRFLHRPYDSFIRLFTTILVVGSCTDSTDNTVFTMSKVSFVWLSNRDFLLIANNADI